MPRIRTAERHAILDLQVVRPIQEWGGSNAAGEKKSNKGKETAVLGSIDTNVRQKIHPSDNHLSATSSLESVPSIEITSPNTSEMLSKGRAPWLTHKNPSYVH